MKMVKFLLVLMFLLYGCSEKSTEPIDSFTVSGKVSNSQGPIANAEVSIDSSVNWETTTDNKGEFKISGVTRGDHLVRYGYTNTDGSFVKIEEDLTVVENIVLNNLKLPIPPHLQDPAEVGVNSILLNWNSTDALDFREYKLYRKNTPGLDETTGELIFVSTSKNDTTYNDTGLISGQTYYYRVYIMNEFGSLGGSNIVNAQTTIGNIIPDGDFEDLNSLNNWQITRGNGTNYSTILDDSVKYNGSYSLFNKNPELSTQSNKYSTFDSNFPVNLIPQSTYKLSGWAKAEGQRTDIGGVDIGIPPYVLITFVDYGSMGDSVNVDWTYKEIIFQAPSATDLKIHMYFAIENVWIDDISLELIQ